MSNLITTIAKKLPEIYPLERKEWDDMTIYWAAPVFTQAERTWNRMCAGILRGMGYKVILPQDEARMFTHDDVVNTSALAKHCCKQAIEADIMVAVLDGSDSDSGTSMEVGLRIGHRRALGHSEAIIGVRTDFRASEDGQLNAMFRLIEIIIYNPPACEDIEMLCREIAETTASPLVKPAARSYTSAPI